MMATQDGQGLVLVSSAERGFSGSVGIAVRIERDQFEPVEPSGSQPITPDLEKPEP